MVGTALKLKPRLLLRNVLTLARQKGLVKRRRLICTALLLVIEVLSVLVCLWVFSNRSNDLEPVGVVAPPTTERVFPFRDLCDAVMSTPSTRPAPRTTHDDALRHRLRRIPADGGAAGVRWSAATGLPLPSDRQGREVTVQFATLSTHLDDTLAASTTAAAMAGVPLDVVGVGWRWFTFIRRMELFASYAEQSGFQEEDVLVLLDSDAMLSGEDVYESLAAFVASTAATAAEHAQYAVRDVRLGRRLPPVLFSAEYNCMHAQAYRTRQECPTGYDRIDSMMAAWAQHANTEVPAEHRGGNPFRYLNAGVIVGRVWALRMLWAAAQKFTATHPFYEGEEWWCDQSVYGSLYLQLRWWEVTSHSLDSALPQPLDKTWNMSDLLFPPLVLPDPLRGPHGLPGGLLGLDSAARFTVVISTQMESKGLLQISGVQTTENTPPERAVQQLLRESIKLETGRTGTLRSSHRLQVTPRSGFDCANTTASLKRAECRYRAAVLGLAGETGPVTPLLWHFAGKYKRHLLTRFRTVFPWYTPTLWNGTCRSEVVDVLRAAPRTAVWYINATTDRPLDTAAMTLDPHQKEDDVSFEQLCNFSTPKK